MIMILICFLAPWLAMFLRGHAVQGVLCILLHLSLIGWIPATIWALIVCRDRQAA
ncbi:YqaE/Pmp3 family membrane protein [Lichenibacterium ramalinae]|uniref:YqaE/Pmp3 family membrane protein n=1 Tax=Lichenibacterium ramalinae TaxID=2316527 RepID=A0A4Q2R7M9_9HYPH|nr:YqaE/Pmp3 family membrane protein [Lichenibacterium ramalinae]RYB01961.1 YqaE/Pmp3 family membrane protein [Lichenibacterium ramalinae]